MRKDCFLFIEDKNSDKLVVFFSAAHAPSFNGYRMMQEYAVNKLFIRDPTRSWYGRKIDGFVDGPDELKDEIKKITYKFKSENIIFMGGSMGGYAAILFGVLLEVGSIVAFGPQMILNGKLPRVPKDGEKLKYHNLYHLLTKKSPESKVDIWLGTEDLVDVYNISDCKLISDVNIFPIKHSPHNVLFYLKQNNLLKQIISSYIIKTNVPPEVEMEKIFFDDNFTNVVKEIVEVFYINNNMQLVEEKLNFLMNSGYKYGAILLWMGKCYSVLKKTNLSKQYLKESLKYNPDFGKAYFELGLLYMYTKDFKEAEQYFRQAITACSTINPSFERKLGVSLMSQNRLQEALDIFLKILPVSGNNSALHYQIGLVKYKLGNYEESYKSLLKAYRLGKNDDSTIKHMNQALSKLNVADIYEKTVKKQISLLVYGNCSNAGDVLIYQCFKALFADSLKINYKHIRMDKLENMDDVIIIGPGGILSGSYEADKRPNEWLIRYLDLKKLNEFKQAKKQIFFFGTGTNTPENASASQKPFNDYSSKVIADLIALSQGVYLRGHSDIQRIQKLAYKQDIYKFRFQPCPSLFSDRLFNIKPDKKDIIALNLPLGDAGGGRVIGQNNYKNHPILKFVKYANSFGLKVCFCPNHNMDINEYVFEMFDDVLFNKENFMAFKEENNKQKWQYAIQQEWESYDSIANRFNGFRFAFGARLHAWLPYMAFNTPSLFLTSNPIRIPMPIDYFENSKFQATVPWHPKTIDAMIQDMIDRLSMFIKEEDALVEIIKTRKEFLWDITQKNKNTLLAEICYHE
jgi:tetratricopeptide (TPR) repeat protein